MFDMTTLHDEIEHFISEAQVALTWGNETWIDEVLGRGDEVMRLIDTTLPVAGTKLRDEVAEALDALADAREEM